MTAALVVLSSCDDLEVARQIADTLVQEGLAACVSLTPAVESVYRWQGRVTRASETLLIIKCLVSDHGPLTERLRGLHPYDVPEIMALPVALAAPEYLAWMEHRGA